MSDELASTLFSIQEFMARVNRRLDQIESSHHCKTTPPPAAIVSPPIFSTTNDTRLAEQEVRVERLESRMNRSDYRMEMRVGGHQIEARRVYFFLCQSLEGKDAFNVEEAIARGLWTDTVPSLENKGKRIVGLSSRSREIDTISYQHQRPAHHSYYMSPTARAHCLICSISISQFMFSSLTLLKLACNHDHHI
ncbi:hypothetical protein CK203_114259 [Vitis vinifera]|uniref:Uncharacterized protein n=1 Tax=Vitis vinifera TaxID=29760 RepID=A0A438CAA9_VITVI|nr:hypothetical protein CK203_114259 [Vitis vinifera]